MKEQGGLIDSNLLIIINKISVVVKWAGCWRAQNKPPLVDQVTHLKFIVELPCKQSSFEIVSSNLMSSPSIAMAQAYFTS